MKIQVLESFFFCFVLNDFTNVFILNSNRCNGLLRGNVYCENDGWYVCISACMSQSLRVLCVIRRTDRSRMFTHLVQGNTRIGYTLGIYSMYNTYFPTFEWI